MSLSEIMKLQIRHEVANRARRFKTPENLRKKFESDIQVYRGYQQRYESTTLAAQYAYYVECFESHLPVEIIETVEL